MIRVKVEMFPFGETPSETIVELEIANTVDHPKAPHWANYNIKGKHMAYGEEIRKEFRVTSHKRELGIFPLLERIFRVWNAAPRLDELAGQVGGPKEGA